jgi:hypothetical protein
MYFLQTGDDQSSQKSKFIYLTCAEKSIFGFGSRGSKSKLTACKDLMKELIQVYPTSCQIQHDVHFQILIGLLS